MTPAGNPTAIESDDGGGYFRPSGDSLSSRNVPSPRPGWPWNAPRGRDPRRVTRSSSTAPFADQHFVPILGRPSVAGEGHGWPVREPVDVLIKVVASRASWSRSRIWINDFQLVLSARRRLPLDQQLNRCFTSWNQFRN